MTREMIQESYSVQELLEQRKHLKSRLSSDSLTQEEAWEIDELVSMINKRIRLMSELLIGLRPTI
jgi:hypothetical protein